MFGLNFQKYFNQSSDDIVFDINYIFDNHPEINYLDNLKIDLKINNENIILNPFQYKSGYHDDNIITYQNIKMVNNNINNITISCNVILHQYLELFTQYKAKIILFFD